MLVLKQKSDWQPAKAASVPSATRSYVITISESNFHTRQIHKTKEDADYFLKTSNILQIVLTPFLKSWKMEKYHQQQTWCSRDQITRSDQSTEKGIVLRKRNCHVTRKPLIFRDTSFWQMSNILPSIFYAFLFVYVINWLYWFVVFSLTCIWFSERRRKREGMYQ